MPTPGFIEKIVSAFEFTIGTLYIYTKTQKMMVNIVSSAFRNDIIERNLCVAPFSSEKEIPVKQIYL